MKDRRSEAQNKYPERRGEARLHALRLEKYNLDEKEFWEELERRMQNTQASDKKILTDPRKGTGPLKAK